MNSREKFLTGLFSSLEAGGIRYCVLRNYDNIFTDDSSDIDLILGERDLVKFTEILHAAATSSGHRFVHSARYANFSFVFWSAESEFIRIDFETEARWRFFPVLSAESILDAMQRRKSFFVPSPQHESVILFLQATWRGSLSERYCRQLGRLYESCADKEELRRTYRQAFGSFGDELVRFHSQIATAGFSSGFCARLRRSIMRHSLSGAGNLSKLAHNVYEDAHRLWERVSKPAGISLLFASSCPGDKNFGELMRKIEFLFPVQKCFVQTIDLTKGADVSAGGEVRLKLKRLRALFKGGLFVRHYAVGRDADLKKIIHDRPRLLYPSRAFFCMEDASQRLCLGHVGSGFMTDSAVATAGGKADVSAFLIEFISTILEKEKQAPAMPRQPGVFAVLIGLDGSGKTTLARNLCRLASLGKRFNGVSYFHWRPKFFNRGEFPLPEYEETPRKKPAPKTLIHSAFSSARLCKNLLLANAAYLFRVRGLRRRNQLILIDRYFYNYELDADSVKYSGPAWLLKRLLPLFPKPDVVVTLDADAEALLARKRELSPEQITRQIAIKDNLDFHGSACVAVNAMEPAARVADNAMAAVTNRSLWKQKAVPAALEQDCKEPCQIK